MRTGSPAGLRQRHLGARQRERRGYPADRVVTGILRGSLEALRSLKGAIEAVEALAERQLAEAVEAATGGPAPSNTAH